MYNLRSIKGSVLALKIGLKAKQEINLQQQRYISSTIVNKIQVILLYNHKKLISNQY